jgi:hypothetical protein
MEYGWRLGKRMSILFGNFLTILVIFDNSFVWYRNFYRYTTFKLS